MKYKVIKEFANLKKGDILANSAEDPDMFSFVEETNCSCRAISMSSDYVDMYYEDGYLLCLEEAECSKCPCECIARTLTLIRELKQQYKEDNDLVTQKYSENQLPYCAKLEADTVHSNLIKVLNKIEESLNEQTCKDGK